MCQDFPCQKLSLCKLRFICTKFMPWSKTFITFAWQKIMPFKTLQQFQQIFLCLKKNPPSKPVYTCSVNNQLMQKLKLPPSHWLLRIKYKSWQAKIDFLKWLNKHCSKYLNTFSNLKQMFLQILTKKYLYKVLF